MMQWGPFIQWLNPVIAIILSIILGGPGHAFQIEIKNHKLSIEADQVPLQDLLKQIAADHDIIVRMAPSINPPVSASFDNRNLEEGLKTILKPHNFALVWKSNPKFAGNPSEPPYLLTQIQVYRPGQKSKMIDINASFGSPPAETGDVLETRVAIKNNKVFVPVILAYDGREVQTTLLLDTGASSIVLHQNVADQLEIDDFKESQGEGVGGVKIPTRTTRLSYVTVGSNTKENLRADIIDYHGSADGNYNGLLGMNFLGGLKYTIDFERQTIRWNP
jgi:hypothetical protein